jgi:hypothetical protein
MGRYYWAIHNYSARDKCVGCIITALVTLTIYLIGPLMDNESLYDFLPCYKWVIQYLGHHVIKSCSDTAVRVSTRLCSWYGLCQQTVVMLTMWIERTWIWWSARTCLSRESRPVFISETTVLVSTVLFIQRVSTYSYSRFDYVFNDSKNTLKGGRIKCACRENQDILVHFWPLMLCAVYADSIKLHYCAQQLCRLSEIQHTVRSCWAHFERENRVRYVYSLGQHINSFKR